MHRWPAGLAATGVLLLVFFVALSLPVPDKAVAAKALVLAANRAPHAIVISGNSVLSHTSRCDGERRTLTELMSAQLDGRVSSVGAPGQRFAESANYLALALRQDNVDTAVFMLAPYQLGEHEWFSLQTQMYLSARASSALTLNSFPKRFAAGYVLTGGAPSVRGFEYAGTRYPSYEGLKQYFAREKIAMGCPETLGYQRDFIEAYYWFQFVSGQDLADNIRDLARIDELARARGKRFLLVLMPSDSDDVRTLNPQLADQMEQRLSGMARQLTALNVPLLDLTRAPSVEHFADRWCACGHLSELGRRWVSQAVSARLRAATPTDAGP